jgi:hypothetical protein
MSLAAGSLAGFPCTITRSMHTTLPHIPNLQTPTNDSRCHLDASVFTDNENMIPTWKCTGLYVIPLRQGGPCSLSRHSPMSVSLHKLSRDRLQVTCRRRSDERFYFTGLGLPSRSTCNEYMHVHVSTCWASRDSPDDTVFRATTGHYS